MSDSRYYSASVLVNATMSLHCDTVGRLLACKKKIVSNNFMSTIDPQKTFYNFLQNLKFLALQYIGSLHVSAHTAAHEACPLGYYLSNISFSSGASHQ